MPRSRVRRIAYHSVEASREPWICSHGRGGGVRPSARPASTSWRMVATWPSLVSMKNTPTVTEPSATWRAALNLFDADLRRRGAAEKTRRAYGFDLGDVASWATARGLEPHPAHAARPAPLRALAPRARARPRHRRPTPRRAARLLPLPARA